MSKLFLTYDKMHTPLCLFSLFVSSLSSLILNSSNSLGSFENSFVFTLCNLVSCSKRISIFCSEINLSRYLGSLFFITAHIQSMIYIVLRWKLKRDIFVPSQITRRLPEHIKRCLWNIICKWHDSKHNCHFVCRSESLLKIGFTIQIVSVNMW